MAPQNMCVLRIKKIAEKSRQALTEMPGLAPGTDFHQPPLGHRTSGYVMGEEILSSLPRKGLIRDSEEKSGEPDGF